MGNGEKASGEAIKIGAIITKQPGIDFTDITKTAKAVFDCVNDNGGINGRPVQYIAEPEQTNPQQVASLATKLFEQDKVLGLAGSSSIIDCDVNHKYYEQNDIYVIAAGIARECYFGTNVRNVNMGPYFSALGAAQYLVRQKVKGLAVATAKVPGGGLQQPRRRPSWPRRTTSRPRRSSSRCRSPTARARRSSSPTPRATAAAWCSRSRRPRR